MSFPKSKLRHEKKNNSLLRFEIYNVDLSILNSLRRIILSEIENVAFRFSSTGSQDIKFNSNTSPLHNEFLAHRLSMVPICLSPNQIIDFEQNDYKFTLIKKNTSNEILDVTSNDIKVVDKHGNSIDETLFFPKNLITSDYILINKLKPNIFDQSKGDELNIEMVASKDISKTNSGFSPVSVASFYNLVDESKCQKILNEKLKLIDESQKSDYVLSFNNLEKQKYYYTNEYNEPNKFEFFIQTECALKPEYIFLKAFIVLQEKLENFKNRLINDICNISYDSDTNIIEIKVVNETHTLGNLIQSLFYNLYIRDDNKRDLKFVGYHNPHPLSNEIIFRFGFNNNSEKIFKKFIVSGIETIQEHLISLANEWFEISSLSRDYAKDIEKIIK